MVTVFVMMKTDPHKIPEAAQDIANIEEVEAVYSVAGKWDLIAMIKTSDFEQLSALIPVKIAKVATIYNTETMVAFRTYSDEELEVGFSLGME